MKKYILHFKLLEIKSFFTSHRIFVVNVKGITGKKIAYFSYPYSKIQYYGIETAGLLDIDSDLMICFSNGQALHFDFRSIVDITTINTLISKYTL